MKLKKIICVFKEHDFVMSHDDGWIILKCRRCGSEYWHHD